MSYLENIGKNAKKAFEDLKAVKHSKIKKVLNTMTGLNCWHSLETGWAR